MKQYLVMREPKYQHRKTFNFKITVVDANSKADALRKTAVQMHVGNDWGYKKSYAIELMLHYCYQL
jgi:hypothetical protein